MELARAIKMPSASTRQNCQIKRACCRDLEADRWEFLLGRLNERIAKALRKGYRYAPHNIIVHSQMYTQGNPSNWVEVLERQYRVACRAAKNKI